MRRAAFECSAGTAPCGCGPSRSGAPKATVSCTPPVEEVCGSVAHAGRSSSGRFSVIASRPSLRRAVVVSCMALRAMPYAAQQSRADLAAGWQRAVSSRRCRSPHDAGRPPEHAPSRMHAAFRPAPLDHRAERGRSGRRPGKRRACVPRPAARPRCTSSSARTTASSATCRPPSATTTGAGSRPGPRRRWLQQDDPRRCRRPRHPPGRRLSQPVTWAVGSEGRPARVAQRAPRPSAPATGHEVARSGGRPRAEQVRRGSGRLQAAVSARTEAAEYLLHEKRSSSGSDTADHSTSPGVRRCCDRP